MSFENLLISAGWWGGGVINFKGPIRSEFNTKTFQSMQLLTPICFRWIMPLGKRKFCQQFLV
jgi:hypothetical protein